MDNYYKECPAKMEDGRFFTDYRTSNTREQYVKTINGIVRDDEYRMFLQQNGEKIMDGEWDYMRRNTCRPQRCVHTLPTRMTQGSAYRELMLYNDVETGRIKKTDPVYPKCANMSDYRVSHTNGVKY